MIPSSTPETAVILPDRQVEACLVGLQRSVTAWQFYPAGHPQLAQTLADGYRAWREGERDHRWQEPGLEYRGGGLWLAETRLGPRNPAVQGLARAFGAHGIHRIRRLGPLSADGFRHLVSLLGAAPDALAAEGGICSLWGRSPHAAHLEIRTIRVVPGAEPPPPRDPARPWGLGLPEGEETRALGDPALQARIGSLRNRGPRERRVLDLLLRLAREPDITRFLSFLREITRLVVDYAEAERFREAFCVILFLFREAQNLDALGDAGRRDYLLDTIRLVLKGDFLGWLIERMASEDSRQEGEAGSYVLRSVGKAAVVPLINALVAEKRRMGRRRIVDVLVSIGEPVVPLAIRMLDDQRWYVVRNMVTILGGIGSPEAVRAVLRTSRDPDPRIRREAARALGRARGPDVEDRIRDLLADPDPSVCLMAIAAAALQRSPSMLQVLWDVYRRISIRSSRWNMKPAVLQAVGRTGLPEAAPLLASVARRRPFLYRRRWIAVQQAAVQALGDLGGEEPLATLEDLRDHPAPELRAAARRALAAAREGAGG